MNNAGVFFLVWGIKDYYTGVRKLSDVLPQCGLGLIIF